MYIEAPKKKQREAIIQKDILFIMTKSKFSINKIIKIFSNLITLISSGSCQSTFKIIRCLI